MSDLTFAIQARWAGSGIHGEGKIEAGGQVIHYSAPATMGGKGVGTSPEELLLAAVTACYSGTLFRVLQQAQLPVQEVSIHTVGIVENYPSATRFSRLVVSPTVIGGQPASEEAYVKAAHRARELCFIGKTVRDYLDYAVGSVTIQAAAHINAPAP